MSFEDALEDMSRRVSELRDDLATEEATKTAIIMPFVSRVLGYDVFNPKEVIPEFICDVGTKKGEKIDFAIMREGDVQILIEAKKIGEPLSLDHAGQLVRYFHVSNARIAVLTNGQYWDFYTDLEKPNVMDSRPFLHLDLLGIDPYMLPELKKLTKDAFDLDSVIAAAEELQYVSSIKRELSAMLADVPEDFLRLLISHVYSGSITAKVRDLFSDLVPKAIAQFLNDRVNDRLKTALQGQGPAVGAAPLITAEADQESPARETPAPRTDESIETTAEELEGFRIVRAIVADRVAYGRVFVRDQKSYCAILLDDNNRKPICRLHFNRAQKYLGLFDEAKNETRIPIEAVEDIYTSADALRTTIARYVTEAE